MDEISRIDPSKIDYDEVLRLYKGFKKAEGIIKEKNKELASLRERITNLEELNSQLRQQLQSLESMKALATNLQNQFTALQYEHSSLEQKHNELTNWKMELEKDLVSTKDSEVNSSKKVNDLQSDLVNLWGRYEEAIKIQQQCERQSSDDQKTVLALQLQLRAETETIESLKTDNRTYRIKLDEAQEKIRQCDEQLAEASSQLTGLSKEVSSLLPTREKLIDISSELGTLKVDIARMLRILEHYPSAKGFLSSWRSGEQGMSFIGLQPKDLSQRNRSLIGGDVKLLEHTRLGLEDLRVDGFGALSREEWEAAEITPLELAQLKRIYGLDPFPMAPSMEDEEFSWVPREALFLGTSFLKSRIPNAPTTLVSEFLRELNQIWLRRERVKLKVLKQKYEERMAELKRMAHQSKSYQNVIAEKEVQRLKKQVADSRKKGLSGRSKTPFPDQSPKRESGSRFGFEKDFELDDLQRLDTRQAHSPHSSRGRSNNKRMEASRSPHYTRRSVSPSRGTSNPQSDYNQSPRVLPITPSHPILASQFADDLDTSIEFWARSSRGKDPSISYNGDHPSEGYLRGALWMARNYCLLVEDLSEDFEVHRGSLLEDVVNASRDSDASRAVHRLNLLLISGVNEGMSIIKRKRDDSTQILQGLSSLQIGDLSSFKRFESNLPLESALASSGVEAIPFPIRSPSKLDSNRSFTPYRCESGPDGFGSTLGLTLDMLRRSK